MRPAHVFAKPSADAELQIVALLQGPWRFALRLVMIWLSVRGLTACEIAALFEYDPRTVRRWIDRYNHQRRHSHCAMQSPITYENTYPVKQIQSQAA